MRELAATVLPPDPEKLIINLWKNPDGAIFARSVEVIDKVSRVRFSFNSGCLLDRVFTSRAVGAVQDIVDRTVSQRGMLMLPDLRIDLKDLILQGCRVIVTAAENGTEIIMIRFVKYFGRVLSLFRDGFSHRDCLAENAVDQAVTALEKVYMPLRNFSVYLDDLLANFPHLLDKEKISFLQNIKDEISELGHISDLIVHYVNSQGAITPQAADTQIGARDHQTQLSVPPPTDLAVDFELAGP